jgi:hypothetical protein
VKMELVVESLLARYGVPADSRTTEKVSR